MPTTYAHYSFGEQVRAQLNEDGKQAVREQLPLYLIGLHGPDILFYHKPLSKDHVKELGHEIHRQTGHVFFSNARTVLEKSEESGPARAYVLGVLCHFILDSECHPLVRNMESRDLSHGEIETEFDRVLMERDRLDPLSHRPTKHLESTLEYARTISKFYDGVSPAEIQESLKSMRFFLNLFVSPTKVKRAIVINLLKLFRQYKSHKGLLMDQQANPKHTINNTILMDAYDRAIPVAAEQINKYLRDLEEGRALDQRLDRDFG